HRTCLQKFSLKCHFKCDCFHGLLDNKWIANVTSRKVEELDLGIEGKSKVWTLPNSVFYCKTLVVLKIRGTIEIDPPSSFQLPSLKIITLNLRLRLKYGVCELFKLLSGCPVLEDLSFDTDGMGNGMQIGYSSFLQPSITSNS
ncbi:putative f-box/fbd/lrr-repeat protein, partial [Quercus suber]